MRPVTLFLCGDVMTGRGVDQILPHPSPPILYESYVRDARDYVSFAEERNGPIARPVSFDHVWGEALDELRRVQPDACIVNLETSVTRSDESLPWKEIHYRMNPANVGCLTAAGIDVCVLANNHVLDWGEAGLLETLDVLHSAGLRVAGAGRTRQEAERPAVVPTREGGRVIVVAFGHPSSGIPLSWRATSTRAGLVIIDELSEATADMIGEPLERIRRPGDIVVASLHWGSNWGYEVPDSQIRFAHALIESGIDVVHGHSSHHPRPIEVYLEKLILYGCGDFLSDYEGITGYEEFRGDLPIMYFANLDHATGRLLDLSMVPMRLSRMRLEHAHAEEVAWVGDQLGRISRPYGADVLANGRTLRLAPALPPHVPLHR